MAQSRWASGAARLRVQARQALPEAFSAVPTHAGRGKIALVTGLLYVMGGLVALLALTLPQPALARVEELRTLGLVSLASGVVVLIAGRALPRWTHHLLVVAGSLIITLTVLAGGGGAASIAYASLYVFIAVDTFFFMAWPVAALHTAAALAMGTAALLRTGDAVTGQGVILAGVVCAVGYVTGYLANAASGVEIDPMTELPNRRGFDRTLGEAMAHADRSGTSLMVALLDLDHFRSVNEQEGSGAGDRLLKAVAETWRPLLRPGQTLARFGGDEFAVLLPNCPSDRATVVIDELRRAVPDGRTCSAGMAEWEPGDSASMLVNRADVALYEAKRAGRDRTVHHAGDRVAAHELRRALSNGELQVHFQPIVDLGHDIPVMTGAEALVRWMHPNRGMVPPLDFIPFAESSGLIREIGRHVLFEACAYAARWGHDGERVLKVTVNVSGRELDDPAYADQVEEALLTTGLSAHALVLEITEGTLSAPDDRVQGTLQRLRATGVRIAIDDFGTGYSSLSRLDTLPIDILKIDRSFVRSILPGADSAPLVAAITAMASALGLAVVAEGVEEPHQQRLLSDLGCGEGQGYLFGRPVPPHELELPAVCPGSRPQVEQVRAQG